MLVISTVTKKAYIAVEYKGKEYFSEVDADCKQSERILPEIDKILDKNGIPFTDLGNIAVLVGPGSFTGIRIGVALTKGLCAGNDNHKVIPISTLDLIAFIYQKDNNENKNFYVVMNALSKKYFVAKYSKSGKKLSEEKMIFEEELENIKDNIITLDEENLGCNQIQITPKSILDFAKKLEKEKKFVLADKITPVYIRKAQAEENLNQKNNKKN